MKKLRQLSPGVPVHGLWKLAAHLIVTYNDGCYTAKGTKLLDDGTRVNDDVVMRKIDYPSTWLNQATTAPAQRAIA